MKAMFAAFAAIVLMTVAAPYLLKQAGFSSAERSAGPAVRLDDAAR